LFGLFVFLAEGGDGVDEVLDLLVVVDCCFGSDGASGVRGGGVFGFFEGVACFFGGFVERAGGVGGEGCEVGVQGGGFVEGLVREVAEGVAGVLVAFGVFGAGEARAWLGCCVVGVEVRGW
jgi:hypothetical protein